LAYQLHQVSGRPITWFGFRPALLSSFAFTSFRGNLLADEVFFAYFLRLIVLHITMMCILSALMGGRTKLHGEFFIFQQDSAPVHRGDRPSGTTDTCVHFNRPSPSNSPDANLTDREVWGECSSGVYQTKVYDVDELKQRLINTCQSI